MSSAVSVMQAARRIAPTAGTAIAAGNGSAGAAVDLNAYLNRYVSFKFPGKTHLRFGPTNAVAAATSDYYLAADQGEDFIVTEATRWVSGWGIGGAHAGSGAPTGE